MPGIADIAAKQQRPAIEIPRALPSDGNASAPDPHGARPRLQGPWDPQQEPSKDSHEPTELQSKMARFLRIILGHLPLSELGDVTPKIQRVAVNFSDKNI